MTSINLTFPGLDWGFDNYREELRNRISGKKGTAFADFQTYIPSDIYPIKNDLYSPEPTKVLTKFVDLLAVLKQWAGPPISGLYTDSSYSIRIYMSNILFFKWFDYNFLAEKGKIQLEDRGVIRCNLQRSGFPLYSSIVKHIGPMFIFERTKTGWVKNTKDVKNVEYWTDAIRPFLRKNRLTTKKIEELELRYYSIGQGYAPDYPIRNSDPKGVALYLDISQSELSDLLKQNARKNPYQWNFTDTKRSRIQHPFIRQCAELKGRRFDICTPKQYLRLNYCYQCQLMKEGIVWSSENQCDERGAKPLGRDIPVTKRNDFTPVVRRSIKQRDEKNDPSCLIYRVTKKYGSCVGKLEYGHMRSALETTYKLDKSDGYLVCRKHNSMQGILPLLEFLPEAKEETENLELRTQNCSFSVDPSKADNSEEPVITWLEIPAEDYESLSWPLMSLEVISSPAK